MDKPSKFVLPSPNFAPRPKSKSLAHFLTPSGMTLLPRERQPPPMYGPRGATIPGKFLKQMEPVQHETKQIEPQFCEACELELQSLDDMQRHMAQHQRCQVDSCTFRGHPNVMDKHVALLHSSGIFDKCKKLSTPEEIAAWRDERKKRFPTLANVEIRKRAHEQRLKRGERLEANKSRFGKREDCLKMRKGEREQNKPVPRMQVSEKGKRKRKNNGYQKRKKSLQNVEENAKPQDFSKLRSEPEIEETSSGGVDMFRGTKLLENYTHFTVRTVVAEQNILTGLLGMYGSDEEGTDEDDGKNITFQIEYPNGNKKHGSNLNAFEETSEKNIVTQNDVNLTNTHIPLQVKTSVYEAINDLTSDEPPEETAIARSSNIPEIIARFKSPRQQPKPNTSLIQKSRFRKNSGLDYRKARLRKQNTMLEKLLEPDIRHERNVLLQCVRFVCENNYLDVDKKSGKTS